ncbi:MAG: hypothetical protein WBV79_09965, partial [Rhodomicrobium sp.]
QNTQRGFLRRRLNALLRFRVEWAPLNMFRLRKLTPARSRIGCGAGRDDGVANGIFLIFIRGWNGPKLSLTCRQGDFAEDLSEEGMQTKTSGKS